MIFVLRESLISFLRGSCVDAKHNTTVPWMQFEDRVRRSNRENNPMALDLVKRPSAFRKHRPTPLKEKRTKIFADTNAGLLQQSG